MSDGIIVVDNSENRSSSTMPDLSSLGDTLKFSSNLEELTGADIMISPKKFPFGSLPLIQQHLKAGAILIQVKRGLDFISSFGDRLNHSIAKMQSTGASQSQCILLLIGIFEEVNGNLVVRTITNGTEKTVRADKFITGATYEGFTTARDSWMDRGGVVYTDLRDSSPKAFVDWVKKKHARICKYEQFPVLVTYPETKSVVRSEPLQRVKVADKGRQLLAAIDGIGPKKVEQLLGYFGSVAWAFVGLTDFETLKTKDERLKGFGKQTIQNTKDQCGLKKNQKFAIVEEDE